MANTVVTMKVRTSTTGIKVTKGILLTLETKYVTSPEPKFIEQQNNPNDISITLYESISVPRKDDE